MTAWGDTLRALEAQADELEVAQRYQPQVHRIVEHVVDATPFQWGPLPYQVVPSLILRVVMAYDPVCEEQAFYGHQAYLHRREAWRRRGLMYGVRLYTVYRDCTRRQALRILQHGIPPSDLKVPPPDMAPVTTDEETDDLFAEVARRASFDSKTAGRRRPAHR